MTTNTLISLAGFPQWQLYVAISILLYNQCPTGLLKSVGKALKPKLRMQRQVSEMKSVETPEFSNSENVVNER